MGLIPMFIVERCKSMTCKHNRIIKKLIPKDKDYEEIYVCANCRCAVKLLFWDYNVILGDKHE